MRTIDCMYNQMEREGQELGDQRERELEREEQPVRMIADEGGALEHHIRRAVRAGVEEGIQRFRQLEPRSSNGTHVNVENQFELNFGGDLPATIFTGDPIKSADNKSIRVEIRDVVTKETVRTGSLSCMWVNISVLDGDFDKNEQGCWTPEAFDSSKIGPRNGKGPLSNADYKVKLKHGVAYLKDIAFTDSSSCTRSKKYKLVASVMSKTHKEKRIKAAVTAAIVVKDRRGKAHAKPRSPAWNDEVWCLKNIRKDNAFHKRLNKAGVKTVLEFRTRLASDGEGALRKILGNRMSKRRWRETIENAQRCKLPEGTSEHNASFVNDSCSQLNNYAAGNNLHFNHFGASVNGPLMATSTLQDDPPQQNQQNSIPQLLIEDQEVQTNFVQPATHNEFVIGPSQYNDCGSSDYPLQLWASISHVEDQSGMNGFPAMSTQDHVLNQPDNFNENHFHGQHSAHVWESGTSGSVGTVEANQNSEEFESSIFCSSHHLIINKKKKRWPKIVAVLKWAIKKVPQRKRWL